jgi:hypothetical protein
MAHVIAAGALLAALLPVANPSPSPTPALKTIANVRSTTRCASIIMHANTAITDALSNDQVIGQTITQLRLTKLDDSNAISKRNGLQQLGDLAKSLMMSARAGDDEVKRLRKLAAESKDPSEAKALKAFADELGGALWSQQKVARDLNGFLAYVDFRDMSQWDENQQQANEATTGVPDPLAQQPRDLQYGPNGFWRPMTPMLGHDPNDPTETQQAKWAADDFQSRIPIIMRDENLAANKVDDAIQGC